MLRFPWILSTTSRHYQSHKNRTEKTCFASWQFEYWVFQPPLNLLMFKFLTGKHSKALQGSWNLRSLCTRDKLSWAEGSQMWLQPGSWNWMWRTTVNYSTMPRLFKAPFLFFLGSGFGNLEGSLSSSTSSWRLHLPSPSPTLGAALTTFLWLCHSQLEESPAWK